MRDPKFYSKGIRLYDLLVHPGDLIQRTHNGVYGIFLGRNPPDDGDGKSCLNGWMLTPWGPEELTWAMELRILSHFHEAIG